MTKRERLGRRLKSGWNDIVVRDAVLETKLSKDEKLILLALVSHRDGKHVAGAERGLSVRRVALLASTHKDTPGKIFAKLEQAGLVRVLRDPRERHADRFDLAGLPAALAHLLSGPEGQALSGGKGQQEAPEADPGCPSGTDLAVPPEQPSLSYTEGTKGSVEGISEGISSSPRRRAAGSGPALVLEAPKPMVKKKPKPKPKRTAEEHEKHERIVKAHVAIVLAATGEEPAEEHGAAWKLLDAVKGEPEKAIARIREAVVRGEYGTTSLAKIAGKPNDYIPRKGGGGKQQPKQPNSGLWKLPVENL